ncbi:MAG: type 4a pilus biogenesis protein PilO [Terriglobales bacterium]|jgi:type IV pilus assembly protein PilO
MAKFSEMSRPVQVIGLVLAGALVTGILYFAVYRRMDEQNRLDNQKLQAQKVEIGDLRKYENNMPELNRQIANLKAQLEIQKHIVPDESEADRFMHLMQDTAQSSGIEIRRWTAKPVASKEYYTEVPFDLELDGPYYSVLNFFDKVAGLERIINVSNLQLGAIKGEGHIGHSYQYAPQESVVALCTATTFYSHDATASAPAKSPK